MSQYLKYFPKPLLNDLVAGRWLPVVGAGMSRNAVVNPGQQEPRNRGRAPHRILASRRGTDKIVLLRSSIRPPASIS
jgi:hypothetical protein